MAPRVPTNLSVWMGGADDAELLRLGTEWHEARKAAAALSDVSQACLDRARADKASVPFPKGLYVSHDLDTGVIEPVQYVTLLSMFPIDRKNRGDIEAERLFEQRIKALKEYREAVWNEKSMRHGVEPALEAESDAWNHVLEIQDRIVETPVHTIRGLAVKMRLVEHVCLSVGDGKIPDDELDEGHLIVKAVARDVERLAGEAAS